MLIINYLTYQKYKLLLQMLLYLSNIFLQYAVFVYNVLYK